MTGIRVWLAMWLLRVASAFVATAMKIAPMPHEEPLAVDDSDYAEPEPMQRDAFWHRHRIIRHKGGVVRIVSRETMSEDGEP